MRAKNHLWRRCLAECVRTQCTVFCRVLMACADPDSLARVQQQMADLKQTLLGTIVKAVAQAKKMRGVISRTTMTSAN